MANRYVLRSKDVAQILNMSPDDVTLLANTKKIRGKKVGRFWRFTWASAKNYKKTQQEHFV